MRKNVRYFFWMFLSVFAMSCTDVYREDDSEEEEVILPPGETYTKEKEHCLNVVYYVPADMDGYADWHYRLSGIVLHAQEYFYENFKRYYVDSKFGLELNDENPDYVRIHFIQSERKTEDMQEMNIGAMAEEVLAYFTANPGAKTSDHYLVFLPRYTGSFYKHYYPSTKEGMAFCGCDHERYNIKYFDSGRARATFLEGLGYVLQTLGRACFLPESNVGLEVASRSLMGANEVETNRSGYANFMHPKYNCHYYTGKVEPNAYVGGTPDKIRMNLWDVRYLQGTQLFNDNYSYDPFEVDITEVDIKSKEGALSTLTDTLKVKLRFTTAADLDGVLLLDDPWRTGGVKKLDTLLDKNEHYDTGYDAYSVWAASSQFVKNGNFYEVDFIVPMGNHANMNQEANSKRASINHEIRFRFIGKNGMAFPHPPVSVKGEWGTKLRNVYKVQGHEPFEDGVLASFTHDIATRYGTWTPEK